jgi:multidrug efflux pump subunit AcrB
MNLTPAVIVNIQRQPGANTIKRGKGHQGDLAPA